MKLTIQIITGSRTGERIELAKFPATIGRNAGCDVVFASPLDKGVSNYHATVVIEGSAFILRDMNSTNGTYVDGQQVRRFILTDGLVVRLAKDGPEFRVLLDDEARNAAKKAVLRESGRMPNQK